MPEARIPLILMPFQPSVIVHRRQLVLMTFFDVIALFT